MPRAGWRMSQWEGDHTGEAGRAVGSWNPEGDHLPCLLPSSFLTCRSKKPSLVTPIYMEPPAKEEGAVAVPAVAAAEQT